MIPTALPSELVLTPFAVELAKACAQALLTLADEHATSDAPQAALLLHFSDPTDPTDAVTAIPIIVLDTERDALRAELATLTPTKYPNWPSLWHPNDRYYGAIDGQYLLDEFVEERTKLTLELLDSDWDPPNAVFWPEVARQLNAGPHPKLAIEDWCAAAVSLGSSPRDELADSIPPDLFARLERAGYIGAWSQ